MIALGGVAIEKHSRLGRYRRTHVTLLNMAQQDLDPYMQYGVGAHSGAARKIKALARKVTEPTLDRLGISISVSRKRSWSPAHPYAPVASCQIPGLEHLYRWCFGEPSSDHTLVEVGAFDGYTYSNTWQLAQMGWKCLLFEPVPAHAAACRERYQGMPNVEIHEVAVGSKAGQATLHVAGPYSTADQRTASGYQRIDWAASELHGESITVPSARLDDLLPDDIELSLLVVDVEGGEHAVFEGFDLNRWQPTMMIIELPDVHPLYDFSRSVISRLYLSLIESEYVPVYKDIGNTILIRRSHYETLTTQNDEHFAG